MSSIRRNLELEPVICKVNDNMIIDHQKFRRNSDSKIQTFLSILRWVIILLKTPK